MIKKIIVLLIIGFFLLINTSTILAAGEIGSEGKCTPGVDTCVSGYACLPDPPGSPICQPVFGKIQPPDALKGFLGKDQTGASAISKFLSNFVVLIYAVAAIVLIFMLLWGAFDWMVSGGDKEAVAKARSRILNAFIGILLFAVTFAVLQVLGQFTGFTFFSSPK